MLIFLFLIALFLVGAFCNKYSRGDTGIALMIVSGMLFVIASITIPANYYGTKAEIEQFKSTQATYETARKNINSSTIAEVAAIQIDIAKQNRWLVGSQYWNNTIFDKWIPDEVIHLKPIK